MSMILAAAMVVSTMSLPASAVETKSEAVAAAEVIEETDERTLNFNSDWKFHLNDETNAHQTDYDDSSWEDIIIPHDFSIIQEFSAQYEAESGFLPGGTGWYRKTFVLPEAYDGKALILNFDGVYNHAYVYVNGEKLGENVYGYNDFSFDISDYVTCDGSTENVIAVKAVNEFPSSRWYSGSGIYRDVTLQVAGKVHVADKGTYVTTPDLEEEQNGDVTVHVETVVENSGLTDEDATLRTSILDAEGNVVSEEAASDAVSVDADGTVEVTQEVLVNQPELWSCEAPNLYYVQSEVLVDGEVVDTYETEFGFRYFEFDAERGFILNGEYVKMKGVCLHHDMGALGAASYEDAVYRQLEILKGMGCNAIRSSHNSPSKMQIEACNKLGILVMDEIYDGWTQSKNGNYNDFGKYFNSTMGAENEALGGAADMKWSQFALENTVNRDKNAPSVVMWSIGNELPTGTNGQVSNYLNIAKELVAWIQAIDDTKPITQGDNQYSWSSSDVRTQIDAYLVANGGVAGMNYYPDSYATKHYQQPTWPLVATETASPANSRGVYYTLTDSSQVGNYQCTAYDTACVGWGDTARDAWYGVIKNDFVSGTFLWTGFDYIGEPTGTGPWNGTGLGSVVGGNQAVPNSCYFGVVDTAGFGKDSYYLYSSMWLDDGTTTLHVVPQSWNEEDLVVTNGKVPVYVYSNAAKIELYLNDELVGTATADETVTESGHSYRLYTNASENEELCEAVNSYTAYERLACQFKVTYEEGTLSAKAYDADGNLIEDTYGLDYVTTNSDEGTSLKVTAEKTEIQADGSSLAYISVDVLDANGQFVSAADNNIRFSLAGNGEIVAVDNGNPSTTDKFQQKTVLTSETTANINAFSGKALVIVRSTEKAGGFTLRAESAGLKGQAVTVNTVGAEQGEVYLKGYDLQTEYTVPMGTEPQLAKTAACEMSDGTSVTGSVTWEEVPADVYNAPGEYIVAGVLTVEDVSVELEAFLEVTPVFAAFKNYARATSKEIVPALPATMPGVLINGEEYGAYPVVWDSMKASDFANVGDVITVNGKVTVSETETYDITATIRVAEGETMTPENIAPNYTELTESCGQTADRLTSIADGVSNVLNAPNERWTNWNDHLQSSKPFITFTFEEVREIDQINMYFFTDSSVTVPAEVDIFVAEDGLDFQKVGYEDTEFLAGAAKTEFKLDQAYKAKAVRIQLTQQGNGYVGLTEVEIWTTAYGYTMNDTAVLDTLKVNGQTVDGFTAGEFDADGYEADVNLIANTKITATAQDNASVTVVPADADGIVKVIVQSENQKVKNVYEIQLHAALVNPFVDVTEADYFYDAVLWAVDEKITSGMTPTTFAPFAECVRADIVTFLYRAMAEDDYEPTSACAFTDVPEGAYYYNPVMWAVENGITTGYTADTFAPFEKCTREQIVTFLWRAMGKEIAEAAVEFKDVAEGAYFYEAVRWAVENNVTQGQTAELFGVDKACYRADSVLFIQRALTAK